jgi:hypothetical protein
MSDAQSKLQRLQSSGILESRQFSPDELTMIATITDDEIDVLVRLRERLGVPDDDKQHIKPNIFV